MPKIQIIMIAEITVFIRESIPNPDTEEKPPPRNQRMK